MAPHVPLLLNTIWKWRRPMIPLASVQLSHVLPALTKHSVPVNGPC